MKAGGMSRLQIRAASTGPRLLMRYFSLADKKRTAKVLAAMNDRQVRHAVQIAALFLELLEGEQQRREDAGR